MTNEKRLKNLQTLLESNVLLCTGDHLIMDNGKGGIDPVAQFLRREDDKDTVWLATPTGVLLFVCNDFYKVAQEHCKKAFLTTLDTKLNNQLAVLTLKAPEKAN